MPEFDPPIKKEPEGFGCEDEGTSNFLSRTPYNYIEIMLRTFGVKSAEAAAIIARNTAEFNDQNSFGPSSLVERLFDDEFHISQGIVFAEMLNHNYLEGQINSEQIETLK